MIPSGDFFSFFWPVGLGLSATETSEKGLEATSHNKQHFCFSLIELSNYEKEPQEAPKQPEMDVACHSFFTSRVPGQFPSNLPFSKSY